MPKHSPLRTLSLAKFLLGLGTSGAGLYILAGSFAEQFSNGWDGSVDKIGGGLLLLYGIGTILVSLTSSRGLWRR